jgi:hypothetical protein
MSENYTYISFSHAQRRLLKDIKVNRSSPHAEQEIARSATRGVWEGMARPPEGICLHRGSRYTHYAERRFPFHTEPSTWT